MRCCRRRMIIWGTAAVTVMTTYFAGPSARAQVLHWWRFEEGAFLEDSVGGATLTIVSDPALFQRTALPSTGGGASFPIGFGQAGDNGHALVAQSIMGDRGHAAATTTPVTGDFTIEVLANLQGVDGFNLFARQTSEFFDTSQFSWILMTRDDFNSGVLPSELHFAMSDGSQFYSAHSGILLEENVDYYLSGVFDLAGQLATFYAYDLTNNVLNIAAAPHSAPSLHPDSNFVVAQEGTGDWPDKLLDEVRFSSGTLGFDELLITDAQFAQTSLPNPAEVRLAPRTIHSATTADGVLSARDLRLQQSVRDVGRLSEDRATRLITKFGLPDLPSVADRLQSATLRFHLNEVRGDPGDLVLLHSLDDNETDVDSAAFNDAGYTSSGQTLISESDTVPGAYEADVTELILANYAAEGPAAVAAFRLQLGGGNNTLFGLSMPRDVANQPQLVLSFVPEPSSIVMLMIGVSVLVAAIPRCFVQTTYTPGPQTVGCRRGRP